MCTRDSKAILKSMEVLPRKSASRDIAILNLCNNLLLSLFFCCYSVSLRFYRRFGSALSSFALTYFLRKSQIVRSNRFTLAIDGVCSTGQVLLCSQSEECNDDWGIMFTESIFLVKISSCTRIVVARERSAAFSPWRRRASSNRGGGGGAEDAASGPVCSRWR